MKKLAENLWLLPYPLKLLGADLRRNVTLIRLDSGALVIHSTAPFTPADVARIRAVGRPGWLTEAMRFHDTFSREGHDIFPDLPFLAPAGFPDVVRFPTAPLLPPPAEWDAEIAVLAVAGNASHDEHVFLHRPSRTLIVADLALNFPRDEPRWAEILLLSAINASRQPGMSRPFRDAVTDVKAFRASMDAMLAWDFDRVIVGHGDVIETGGKRKIEMMLERAGF